MTSTEDTRSICDVTIETQQRKLCRLPVLTDHDRVKPSDLFRFARCQVRRLARIGF